jgi:NAD(P)-dependent dehydrogenase (short-subunit alcohol dehydrogenase family)
MRDPAQIVAAVEAAERALGLVTILVNNAGIPDAQHATKQSLELVNSVFDTNLRGPYILSCEVARRLIAAKSPGRMVNISSMGAFRYQGGGGAALYSITKAGIVRMTEALSAEWAGYRINVNCIAPGAFERDDGHARASATSRRSFRASAWRPGADGQHVALSRAGFEAVTARSSHRRRPGSEVSAARGEASDEPAG